MTRNDEILECPCYRICSGLGVETSSWCHYLKSAAPPPGMHSFDPKDQRCPAGVQATVLMLGYMLSGDTAHAEKLKPALDQVRNWARELRKQPARYDPARGNTD
jgi:hypothetical protein